MAKLLLNKASATYNNNDTDKTVHSCEVAALIDDEIKIFKNAINYKGTSNHPDNSDVTVYQYNNGNNIDYQIIIANYNSVTANTITVTDILNKGLSYNNNISLTIDNIKQSDPIVNIVPETDSTGETLTFNITNIEGNQCAILAFSVKQSDSNKLEPEIIAQNSATISYKYPDDSELRTSNSNFVYVKYIKNPPKLTINKTAPASVLCDGKFEYIITVKNEGEQPTSDKLIIEDYWEGTFDINTPEKNNVSISIDTNPVTNVSTDDYTIVKAVNNIIIEISDAIILQPGNTMTIKIKGFSKCDK